LSFCFFFSSRRRHTRFSRDWSSDVCSSDLGRWIAFIADAQLRPDSVVQAERDSLAKLPYNAERDEAPRNDVDIYVIPVNGGEPQIGRASCRERGEESCGGER